MPVDFPQKIYDVEAALETYLTLLFSTYWETHPLGDQRGKAYRYSGEFERGLEKLTPVLPCILLRYVGSDFDVQDENSSVVDRVLNFEFFYVFHNARDEAEARKGCTQVMEKVVLDLTGRCMASDGEDLTNWFKPVHEEFFYGAGGLVVYRQMWQTSWVDGE